jgi:transposase
MDKLCIGVDIAKASFVAAIKIEDDYQVKSFSNNASGFEVFLKWVQNNSYDTYHFCMEATGKYGNALALFLYSHDFTVSVVNPAKIKHFMRSQLSRNKTDSVDAKFICYYCELLSPISWKPLPLEQQKLQALVKRLDAIKTLILQEQKRLEFVEEIIKTSIDEHISY